MPRSSAARSGLPAPSLEGNSLTLRPVLALGLGLLAVFAPSASAFLPPARPPLPNVDSRVAVPLPPEVVTNQIQAAALLGQRVTGVRIERDALLGTPRWVSATRGFLTGPQGRGRAVLQSTATGASALDPYAPVKSFLNEHAALFGHDASVLLTATVKRDYVTAHNGLRTVTWEQSLDGVPVLDGLLQGHITRNGELATLSSRFLPALTQAADLGTPNRASLLAAPTVSAAEAVAIAASDLGGSVDANSLNADAGPAGFEHAQDFRSAQLRGASHVRLVWTPVNRQSLRLSWRVELAVAAQAELYTVVVDAQNGQVLLRRNLTSYIKDVSYRVYTSDSPSPFSPGHQVPSSVQPPVVKRDLVTLGAISTNASPNGWINDDGKETRGNNVDAHTDLDANDLPDLPRPSSTNRVYDFPLDLSKGPGTYAEAAVVNLFYWNNFMHDKLYDLGFTEAAGNFQNDNFSRGGLGNDAVEADAQDGSGIDNANFSTPPDGQPGRMQMYVFTDPDPARDGDLDAEVMLHEYTHGLSNRLVGGGVGIYQLQPAGMGEGWSDFYALALLNGATNDVHAAYAVGGYLTYKLAGIETENYYYGIRRYPYSTDMEKNPLTFKDIDPTQADLHAGVPINPVIGGGSPEEVHYQGEVWCVTLWEARANLIDKLGFEEGNQAILRLVTDGMKLAPPNPNFLEARDAILLADIIQTGGDSYSELWLAFAKRGMGYSAASPTSDTTIGVTEAFDLPDDVSVGVPDGILEFSATPANRSVIFSGSTISVFARVTDGGPVTNATINAFATSVGSLSFRNDGQAPDQQADNSIYSATLAVPTNVTSLTITFVVSAPDKTTATNVVTYSVVPLPTNDNFADAIKVPTAGASYVSNNKFATIEVKEPQHAGAKYGGASLWWDYIPTQPTELLIDTAGSSFNTVVAVYTNNTLATVKNVAAVDDVGQRRQAFLTVSTLPGINYHIAVASFNTNSTGSIYLRVAPGGVADVVPPSLVINNPSSGLITTNNQIVISGTAFDPQPNASGLNRILVRVNTASLAGGNGDSASTSAAGPSTVINWSRTVALKAGVNTISVTATDIAGNQSSPASIQVTYRPQDPVNDVFYRALALVGNSGTSSVNTRNAVKESGEPLHANNAGGRSAWWTFTAPADGLLTLDTTNSTFDTLLGVYTGTRVDSLTTVGSNDDAYDGVKFSGLTQPVLAGQTYRIAVDGFDGVFGVVYLNYKFTPSSLVHLTVNATPGGTVTPSSGLVTANSTIIFTALADDNYVFAGWEGADTSTDNPLELFVAGDTTLTAKFTAVGSVTDDFETGDLKKLPWTTSGNANWMVQTNSVGGGHFAARSGVITNLQSTSLKLIATTPGGPATFAYRVSSEFNWDYLIFSVNGKEVNRWSGEIPWTTFAFMLPAGSSTLEWQYSMDVIKSGGLDAAFIDNLTLPVSAPAASLLSIGHGTQTGLHLQLHGTANQQYVIQASTDLLHWDPIATNVPLNGVINFVDPDAKQHSLRFYRGVAR